MLLNEVFNLPEKQWTPDGNHVYAELFSVGEYKTDKYGFKQPVTLLDLGGNKLSITVQTKFEKGLMTPAMVGAKASWRLKWYGGQRGKQLVGYCLDALPNGGQAPQQSAPQGGQWPPPPASQGLQQATGPAKPAQDVDWDAKDLRNVRMNGVNNATKLVCLCAEAGIVKEPSIGLVKQTAEIIVDYIYRGLPKASATPSPAMSGEDYGPPPTEEDVPDFLNENTGG